MVTSKLNQHFSSHLAAFALLSSSHPDNITLNPANRKADQSISDFQTGTGAAAHVTIDIEQLFLLPEQLLLTPLPVFRILMLDDTSSGST